MDNNKTKFHLVRTQDTGDFVDRISGLVLSPEDLDDIRSSKHGNQSYDVPLQSTSAYSPTRLQDIAEDVFDLCVSTPIVETNYPDMKVGETKPYDHHGNWSQESVKTAIWIPARSTLRARKKDPQDCFGYNPSLNYKDYIQFEVCEDGPALNSVGGEICLGNSRQKPNVTEMEGSTTCFQNNAGPLEPPYLGYAQDTLKTIAALLIHLHRAIEDKNLPVLKILDEAADDIYAASLKIRTGGPGSPDTHTVESLQRELDWQRTRNKNLMGALQKVNFEAERLRTLNIQLRKKFYSRRSKKHV